MTNLVHNERMKLLAGALNTTGIGVTVTGAVAPTIGALYGNLATVPRWWLLLIAFACLGRGSSYISRRSISSGGCVMVEFFITALAGPFALLCLGAIAVWATRRM